MIIITLYNDAIIAKGHANYKEYGKDIYCAGVSAVLLSAFNWFKKQDVNCVINEGDIQLIITKKTKDNMYKLELLKIQLLSFKQKQFKPYITLKKIRKDFYEK